MKFTVFTGCYNSEPFIERVFSSVKNQTYKNFEWIIIDDCSKDNTVNLINDFILEHPEMDIKFLKNEVNQGVAKGRWKAINMATGSLFVTWDHDDIAKPFQLGKLKEVWEQYGNNKIGNIWSLCEDEFGKLVGNEFPERISVSNYFDYYDNYIMGGVKPLIHKERFVCSRVDALKHILKKYQDESILPAGSLPNGDDVWGMMALEYDTIFFNEIVRIYFIEPDRPSMSTGNRTKNPERVFVNKRIWINYYLPRMPSRNWKLKLRLHFAFALYGYLSGRTSLDIVRNAKTIKSELIVLIFLLPAFFLKLKLTNGNK